jgi:phage gpG-like protein
MRQLEALISKFEGNARAVPMAVIGETFATAMDDLIQSEGDGNWDPFSPVTLRVHPRRRGGKLLQDTGLLANFQIGTGPNWIDILSPAPYARYQQEGTRRTRGMVYSDDGIPARDFTDIDMDAALAESADLVLQELVMR